MCEFFKELGKHLLNLALLIAGALIVQPLVNNRLSIDLAFVGAFAYLTLVGLSYILIARCDKG